jgi:hypothetical protein
VFAHHFSQTAYDGKKLQGFLFTQTVEFPEQLLLAVARGVGFRVKDTVSGNSQSGYQRIKHLKFGVSTEIFYINNGTDIYAQLLSQGSLGHSLLFAGLSDDRT